MGRKIVDELKLDPGVDTLSKWMAHYIAEQITVVEASNDVNEKKQCFEAILKIWQRLSTSNNSHNPFIEFESIFSVLQSFDSNLYYPNITSVLRMLEEKAADTPELENAYGWLKIAMGLDGAATVLIEHSINTAYESVMDEKTKEWISESFGIPNTTTEIICKLNERDKKAKQIEMLKSKIKKLDAFVSMSKEIKDSYSAKLDNMLTENN